MAIPSFRIEYIVMHSFGNIIDITILTTFADIVHFNRV